MGPSSLHRRMTARTAYEMRLHLRKIALIVTLALATASCSGGSDDDPVRGDGGDPNAPAAMQELVVGAGPDPWIESETDRKRFPNFPLHADVCETLVRMDTHFQLESGLATDWEYVENNTFRFHLREEAQFSDGRPVDAEAVRFTVDYILQEPSLGGVSQFGPESTNVVDDRTVDIRPEETNLRLLQQLPHATNSVLAPTSDPLNDPNVTCSGPLKVASYSPETELVVERNEGYWGDPAKLDKLTFRFYPDDTTRALALQNGEVDLISDVPRSIATSLADETGIKVQQSPVGLVILLYVARRGPDSSDKLLADPLLRRAVAHAIDKQSFVDGVLDGYGEVVSTATPPSLLGSDLDTVGGIPYDLDAASDLLDEAGWVPGSDGIRLKDGRPLTLSVVFSTSGIDITMVEFVQAQLSKVGIDAQVDQLDSGAYSDRVRNGEYDLNMQPFNQRNADPSFALTLRWSARFGNNSSPYDSPGSESDFERIIEQIQQTADEDELRRLSAEATHELLVEEVAGIPLAGTYNIYAMKEEVQGLDPHPSNTNQRWSNVFISE